MTALLAADSPSIVASGLAGALAMPFPDVVRESKFYINVRDFGYQFDASITDFEFARDRGKVIVQAGIKTDAVINLSLLGTLFGDFRITDVWLEVTTFQAKPIGEFTAATLFALLGLSRETDLRIPVIGLDLGLSFDLSLTRISQRLQMRQTAYRLMVIEQATGLELSVPEKYSSEDVKTITYLYRAIVNRHFVWPIGTITVYVPAIKERLAQFPRDDTPSRQELGPTRVVRNLFGHTIDLGEEELLLDDAVIENLTNVRSELARDDGHPVEVKIRPLSGKGEVVLKNAPRLPNLAFDSNIQALIDLEPHLDEALANRYNALAASTLGDLTEEEKSEVTTRPELDEGALLLNDPA